STNTTGTTFTVKDVATAAMIFGGTGQDTISASGFTFTADQRNAIFATASIEKIVDQSGTSLNLKNTGLSISDVDAGSGSVSVTLSVTEGKLDVAAGTSGASVSNSGSSSVTITGTVAQINALLGSDGTSAVSYSDHSDVPG